MDYTAVFTVIAASMHALGNDQLSTTLCNIIMDYQAIQSQLCK